MGSSAEDFTRIRMQWDSLIEEQLKKLEDIEAARRKGTITAAADVAKMFKVSGYSTIQRDSAKSKEFRINMLCDKAKEEVMSMYSDRIEFLGNQLEDAKHAMMMVDTPSRSREHRPAVTRSTSGMSTVVRNMNQALNLDDDATSHVAERVVETLPDGRKREYHYSLAATRSRTELALASDRNRR